MNPAPHRGARVNPAPRHWFYVYPAPASRSGVYLLRSKKDAFEREKRLKYHGSALKNLKLRLQITLKQRGAG